MLPRLRISAFLSVATAIVQFCSGPVTKADSPLEHALFRAIRQGDIELTASLLREGAPANVQSSDGTTPLMLATLHSSVGMVRLLLEHGADANAVNQSGGASLIYAAGDVEKVRLLIERGADVNAQSKLG